MDDRQATGAGAAGATGAANPILLYHPDGYDVAREDLKGRHSAGEGFLTGFLEQTEAREVFGLCVSPGGGKRFTETVQSAGRKLKPVPLSRADVAVLRRQGLLNIPAPGIAEEARIRRFLGDEAYALCGVTHTICSRQVLDGVADIVTAPVQPWDALICTSPAVLAALSNVLQITEEKLRSRLGATEFVRPLMPIIPLGVHTERFARNDSDRTRWRQKLGIPDDTIVVLFFGRLSVHAKASPFQLAQSVEAATKETGKAFAVLWCGWFSNEFQQNVFMQTAKRMAPSVSFHHVDGRGADIRFSIWAAADIFCSFSDNLQESFGLTVIEAMAASLPVVVSNWDGYRMTVKHGETGVLIDTYFPGSSLADAGYRYITGLDTFDLFGAAVSQICFVDVAEAARWLGRLAQDESLRRKLGAAARESAERQFDWSAVLPRYFELWREQTEMVRFAQQKASEPRRTIYDAGAVFSGFPSHHLNQHAIVERGSQFDAWEDITKWPGIVLNGQVLTTPNNFRRLRDLFSGEATWPVAELLAKFDQADRLKLERTLHWVIKIGLLRLKSG